MNIKNNNIDIVKELEKVSMEYQDIYGISGHISCQKPQEAEQTKTYQILRLSRIRRIMLKVAIGRKRYRILKSNFLIVKK
jgi:hypothetical protein